MTKQPDNLFREKLGNLQMNAPVGAWSRIETNLDKPSRKVLWLKIAAGIALLSVATVLILSQSTSDQSAVVASVEQTPINSQVIEDPVPSTENLNPETPAPVTQDNRTSETKEVKQSSVKTKSASITKTVTEPIYDIEKMQEPIVVADVTLAEISHDVAQSIEDRSENSDANTPVYLVYSADEVNKKYLKSLPEEDATPTAKKTSRMQMLVGLANNIKSGDGLTELRQMKDEIFALNFIDEKKRQQKKINEL